MQKKGRFAAVRNLFSSEHTIKRAVDDITFSVDDGEIVGFIGKNGAGKSTTIKNAFRYFAAYLRKRHS